MRSDGTHVSSSNVKEHCKDLTNTSRFLIDKFISGRPKNWPHEIEKITKWSQFEKERLIEEIKNLPEVLFSKRLLGIYRLKKSKDFPNPASNSEGVIVFYDTAFARDNDLKKILAHELAHQLFSDLSYDEQRDYRRATGWRLELEQDGKIFWTGRKSGYVDDDGKTSFEEDFANNIEYYLYNSDNLKKVTPEAFDWIKSKYGEKLKLK